MKGEFGNLRENTVKEIFLAAVSKNRITRANIADSTGLSVMTVGKAADAFVALRVLHQSLSQDSVSGRRSRILSVSKERWIGVFDVSTDSFSLKLCDLSLHLLDKFTYRYNANYFVDENLSFFLEKAAVFINRAVDDSLCCGVGVLLPGELDPTTDRITNTDMSRLGSVKIRKAFESFSSSYNLKFGDIKAYSAYSVRGSLDDGMSALYVFADKHEISSCYLHRDDKLEKARFCRMGIIPVNGNESLNSTLLSERAPDKTALILSRILFTVFVSVPVDRIYIAGNRFSDMDAFTSLVTEYINQICIRRGAIPPEILSRDTIKTGVCGICAAIRAEWFDNFILEI